MKRHFPRLNLTLAIGCVFAAALSMAPGPSTGQQAVFTAAAPAEPPAPRSAGEMFSRMASDAWVPRTITFKDLGFTDPVVLGYPDTIKEIYLPVPPGVNLANATLQLDASYVRADGGRTTLIYAIDGSPVMAKAFAAERGDASATLTIDGKPRPSGFVRLNIDWRTAVARENTCADARTPGNLVRIEPTSKFVFRFNGSEVRDLTSAWAAMPSTPTILIAGNQLSAEAYDTAWRVGVALERAGKRPVIKTLPQVGETVNMQGIAIPQQLKGIPGFAGLTENGPHKIKDAAEAGAVMALGAAGPVQADIVIADRGAAAAMAQPLEAIGGQIRASSPDADAAFQQWRTAAIDPWGKPVVSNEIRLANVLGRPTIVIAPDAGAKAAGLFTQIWQHAAAGPNLVVGAAEEPGKGDRAAVSLRYLGAKPASFDVLAKADWNATFDIGSVANDGRAPGTLVMDVAASPSAARTPPVVSVFMNDVLLGAKEMEAHGRRERIVAPIPRYALQTRNVVKVSFVRQLASDRCRETPEPYPVAVLASSHMLLDKIDPAADFTGLMAKFADGGTLFIPQSHLDNATTTLPRVIRLAASTGLSPVKAKMQTVAQGAEPKIEGPYLAVDVMPKDVAKNRSDKDRLFLTGSSDKPVLDVKGLNRVGVIEVAGSGNDIGAVYRTLGSEPPPMDKPIQLSSGNVAIMGNTGLRGEVNTRDPAAYEPVREAQPAFYERSYWWLLPIVIVALFIGVLVFASRARRMKKQRTDA